MQGAKAYFTLEGDHNGRSEAVKIGRIGASVRGSIGEELAVLAIRLGQRMKRGT